MSFNVKDKLFNSDAIVLGAFIREFNTPGISSILEHTGSEFVVFDMEHSGFSMESIRQLLSYSRGLNIEPIVRIPDKQYSFIARALDLGAKGIMAPSIETKEEALAIVKACKYSPLGVRGTTFVSPHDDFAPGDIREKIKAANDGTLVIVQIETEKGVGNVDEIISVPGIDVAWIGHIDLSVSMGVPGDVNHPKMVEAMDYVGEACKKYGKIAGRLAPDVDTALSLIEKGYRILAYSNDVALIQNGMKTGIMKIREQVR